MGIVKRYYKLRHPGIKDSELPNWCNFSVWQGIRKMCRKFLCQSVIPFIPFNSFRVWGYRFCGFSIGSGTFIGMRCYLDDLCSDKMDIGNNVTISYGVFFACHGRKQNHNRVIIKDGAYIGMRASIIAPKGDVVIGEKSIIGAQTLVNISVPDRRYAVGIPCRVLDKVVDD